MDSDRVLVMDAGTVLENGPPAALLEDANGAFSALVAQTGRNNAKHLRSLARPRPRAAAAGCNSVVVNSARTRAGGGRRRRRRRRR